MFDLMDGEETDAYPASVIQTARTGNANGQALDREHDHIAHLHAELETMPVLGKERAHDHITHLRATMPPFRMHERTNAPRANAVTYTLEEWSASPTHCQGTIRIGTEAVGHGIAWEIAHAAAGGCALALVAQYTWRSHHVYNLGEELGNVCVGGTIATEVMVSPWVENQAA
ncbi:uncharacterized protein CcaverHIS019_0211320 [Cutaneotrichosporon cavernicola]|uniref:Uncharacterized protein n=1 Tax=Cutaneotrichosporon cavernicola TaxID=279322 RepID=A0AA48I8H0_9TREE|nr:uncharacterized protein CcaverHIS019_0211320 [Cutaneotrichosporon cavernicola]BEI89770.1 hypothetical protein CcaverHIS019_0211320 [Cutaneotrichosporon cavernicola]